MKEDSNERSKTEENSAHSFTEGSEVPSKVKEEEKCCGKGFPNHCEDGGYCIHKDPVASSHTEGSEHNKNNKDNDRKKN